MFYFIGEFALLTDGALSYKLFNVFSALGPGVNTPDTLFHSTASRVHERGAIPFHEKFVQALGNKHAHNSVALRYFCPNGQSSVRLVQNYKKS